MKRISIENFQIFGSEITKNVGLDFTKSKVIITGNNGVGKSSIINLIFSMMTNQNGFNGHVRYDKIIFEDDDKKYEIGTNKSFDNFSGINGEERDAVSGYINAVISNLNTIASLSANSGNDKLLKLIENASKFQTTDGFAKLTNFINSQNLGDVIEANELVQITVSGRLKSVRTKTEILTSSTNINSYINSMNSEINRLRRINDDIQLMNFKVKSSKEIEYISIFRDAEEYLGRDNSRGQNINQNNRILINYELSKPNVDEIIKNINDDVLNVINKFKVDFFNNVANDSQAEVLDDYGFLKNLTALSNDNSFANAGKLIESNNEYKKNIGKYFTPLAKHGEKYKIRLDSLNKFLEAFNRSLNMGKEVIMDGSNIMLKQGEIVKPLNINDLSAGEKQMFKLLRVLHLSNKKFLILDEPEISLSILWQQILRESIDIFSRKKGNNVLMVTHSPYMIMKEDMRKENNIIVSL